MHSSLFRATVALMATASALTPPLYSLQNGPTSATSRAQTDRPRTIVDQSISGDVHRNGAGHSTLTVPEGSRKLKSSNKDCDILTFAFVQKHQVAGASVDFKLVSRFVWCQMNTVFSYLTLSLLKHFSTRNYPLFDQIVKSFHSTANRISRASRSDP